MVSVSCRPSSGVTSCRKVSTSGAATNETPEVMQEFAFLVLGRAGAVEDCVGIYFELQVVGSFDVRLTENGESDLTSFHVAVDCVKLWSLKQARGVPVGREVAVEVVVATVQGPSGCGREE